MIKIAAAGNVENPCLLALIAKGYVLSIRHHEEEIDAQDYEHALSFIAEKDGNRFIGFGPPELLGLVHMWEIRGNDWQTRDDETFILDRLPDDEKW